jgi:nitronate monooxygenase
MTEVERADTPAAILSLPLQNALTRPLRNAAARQGRVDYLSLWASQGGRLARRQPATTLITQLAHETEAVVRRLARSDNSLARLSSGYAGRAALALRPG